jgi:hypothetical protein
MSHCQDAYGQGWSGSAATAKQPIAEGVPEGKVKIVFSIVFSRVKDN